MPNRGPDICPGGCVLEQWWKGPSARAGIETNRKDAAKDGAKEA